MRNKLRVFLVLAAALTALAPWAVEHAHSQEKGASVAGGDRVSRGKNDQSRSAEPRYSPRDSEAAERESGPHASNRTAREIESLERQCLEEVNRIRRSRGVPRLEFFADLLPIAREYSRRMAEERFFSHDDPQGRSVRERVEEASIKWRMVGENLAYSNGYINPVAASLHGWMDSPTHRRNILDPDFRQTAIGAWIASDGTVYFTEIFLKQ